MFHRSECSYLGINYHSHDRMAGVRVYDTKPDEDSDTEEGGDTDVNVSDSKSNLEERVYGDGFGGKGAGY